MELRKCIFEKLNETEVQYLTLGYWWVLAVPLAQPVSNSLQIKGLDLWWGLH